MPEIPQDAIEVLAEAAPHIPLTEQDARLFFDLLGCPALELLPDVA